MAACHWGVSGRWQEVKGVGVLLLLNSDCPVTSVSHLHVFIIAAFWWKFCWCVRWWNKHKSFLVFFRHVLCLHVRFFPESFFNVMRFCLLILETVSVYSFVQNIPVLLIVKNCVLFHCKPSGHVHSVTFLYWALHQNLLLLYFFILSECSFQVRFMLVLWGTQIKTKEKERERGGQLTETYQLRSGVYV